MAEEAEKDEDKEEEVEGSDEKFDSVHLLTIEQMQIQQTQHSDSLADIQRTFKHQEFMMTKIYGCLFLDEGVSDGGGGEGGSAL